MLGFLTLLFTALMVSVASANCVTFDLAAWTPEQRGLLSHIVSTTVSDSVKLRRVADHSVEVCAPTADLAGLNVATLQSTVQALLDAQGTARTTRQTRRNEAEIEVATNTLCNGSLADVITRIDAEKAAIQTDINAATNLTLARDALTTINNRYGAALKFIARCVKSRALLQGAD